MTIGRRIKSFRDERGWSMDHLAELSGVPKSAISDYETEKPRTITVPYLVKLANALGVSLFDLFPIEYHTKRHHLSDQEKQLIDKFENLTPEQRDLLLQLIDHML